MSYWETLTVDHDCISGIGYRVSKREHYLRRRNVTNAPESAGVYVAIKNGVVTYVGCSVSIATRLRCHLLGARPSPYFRGAVIKIKRSRRFGDWLMEEARLINRLRPIGNARGHGR